MRKVHWFIAVVVLVFPIAGFLFYPYMPEQMGTHWSGGDVPDGYMDKFTGTFVTAMVFMVMIATALTVGIGLTSMFSKNRYMIKSILCFDFVVTLTSIFFLVTHIAVLAWNAGADFSMPQFMFIVIGVWVVLFLAVPYYVLTRKSEATEEAKGDYDYDPSTGEYEDSMVEIRGDTIVLKDYSMMSEAKSIKLSEVEYIQEKKGTLWNGRYLHHATNDFRTWFPNDLSLPDKIFMIKIKGKWIKIKFIVENSRAVSELFRTKGLLQ